MAFRPHPSRDPSRNLAGKTWFAGACLAAAFAWSAVSPAAAAQPGANAFAAEEPRGADETAEGNEPAVFLTSDRTRERQLDRARRLAAEGRWSDAAVACDELLGNDRDAFVDVMGGDTNGRSIRSEAAAIVAGFPRPGRDAYLLLFRARAEKRLAEAIAAADQEGVVAVARRWLATPAGRQAAVLTAITSLEADQPLLAAAWLDRVAASGEAGDLEPTLTVMRALARQRAEEDEAAAAMLATAATAGRATLRLAGRDIPLSAAGPDGRAWLAKQFGEGPVEPRRSGADWRQPRGGPNRNTIVDASRPLLVPRYRVPLVRHPDEARRLEQRRRAASDAGMPLLPAGGPLAVGDSLVVQTPLGILAVDFESGKRVWLESAVAVAEPEDGGDPGDTSSDGRLFEDATSGNLSSDGRLVFAVEVPPAALEETEPMAMGFGRGFGRQPSSWNGGNTLTAYDLAAGGAVRWRLPDRAAGRDPEGTAGSSTWFLSAPLVVGNELYVLVEEGGEVRLDARAAADSSLLWQQPLASYDERESIINPEARGRRLAGLAPALADGVLVCPLGGGCVVALDVATRSLLWSHAYARAGTDDAGGRGTSRPLGEPYPVIAAGRVLLNPFDGDGLVCLGLRDGKPAWPEPRRGRFRVAGVAGDRVVVVGDVVVECLDLATGRRNWKLPLADAGRPSGRGVLTPHSLLLPLDTPEVVEIGLADGRIKHRAAARGGSVPGNLVAHRGELVSRGVDSLDVFHQEAALESRIETATRSDPATPWGAFWQGQLAIERGDVTTGLTRVTEALASAAIRVPPGALAETLVRALDRDFAAAARWESDTTPTDRPADVSRRLVDGFLESGAWAPAWEALWPLLEADLALPEETEIRTSTDPFFVLTADRWLRGRLARLVEAADEPLRRRIDERCRTIVAGALADPVPASRYRRLETLAERLGNHRAAADCRQHLAKPDVGTARQASIRASLIELSQADRSAEKAGEPAEAEPSDKAWPLGRVRRSRAAAGDRGRLADGRFHPVPLPLAGAGQGGTPLLQATLDATQRLVVTDRFGTPVTEPLTIEGIGQEAVMPWGNRTSAIEAAVLGRMLVVRTKIGLAAYDLAAAPGRARGLWRRADLAATGTEFVEARWGGGVGGRVARDGGIPLGMRISEPEDAPRGDGRGLIAVPDGVVVPGPRSVALVDPVTGRLAWERRRLPAGLEWCVDDQFLCGLTSDGLGSFVLSLDDGRLVHSFDVPHRRQRLATFGRTVATVRSIDELPGRFTARRVRIELVDPAAREIRTLGEFSGEARATEAGPGQLAVMEPGGALTLFNLADGDVAFQVRLPDPPRQFARLIVQSWQDRYLVFAGAPDDGEEAGDISPLQHLMLSSPAAAPLSGRLWAISRTDGQPLWPAPAVIERHCLHTSQPPGLPVLTFCRILQGRGERETTFLSVLMLDKRTGHAVVEDDRVPIQAVAFVGCDVAGDPENHTITIAEPMGGTVQALLTFTGEPIAPQPPFRGRGRAVAGPRVLGNLELESDGVERGPRGIRGPPAEVRPDPAFFDPEEFE